MFCSSKKQNVCGAARNYRTWKSRSLKPHTAAILWRKVNFQCFPLFAAEPSLLPYADTTPAKCGISSKDDGFTQLNTVRTIRSALENISFFKEHHTQTKMKFAITASIAAFVAGRTVSAMPSRFQIIQFTEICNRLCFSLPPPCLGPGWSAKKFGIAGLAARAVSLMPMRTEWRIKNSRLWSTERSLGYDTAYKPCQLGLLRRVDMYYVSR
ncbi:hypothetical protein LshimejAT787_1303080 [Lyophyllum shimeji]|uniref:Uncharacterized protein n=1 Tax=Lyophyllum shimeji TaxID=47721 RepID=A0A9P3USP3_LYOSH|nr:hypothetical protein LshimejAT787_1303080 [Lyophyllum shimeji]